MDFDHYSSNYDEVLTRHLAFAGGGALWYARQKALRLAGLARARWEGPVRVLDVGCGAGLMLRSLDPEVFPEPCGTDVSAGMVEATRAAIPHARVLPCPPGGALPFEDDSFDLAYASCTVQHVPGPQRPGFFREMARVTRPGGLVVVFEHNPWNPVTRSIVARCEFDEGSVLLSAPEVQTLAREAGLQPEPARYYLFVPPRLGCLRFLERFLHWLPLGGQYLAVAGKPGRGTAQDPGAGRGLSR